ncbi:MAG: LuxR C-terminal-related transcriptional regulator [Acidimicrobiales bacterium]
MLRAAAILGRRFEWSLLPDITGLSRTAVVRVLSDCVAARIIVDEPGQDPPAFRFRHALSRDAVDAGLLTPERKALSARAHRAVEDAQPGLVGWWCDLAAHLAELSGNHERAAQLQLMSGRRALAQGALASAEAALQRARKLDPSPGAAIEVDATLTEVLAMAGKVGQAVEVGTRLLSACSVAGSSIAQQAEYSLRLARALIAQGAWHSAGLQLQVARRLAAGQDEPLLGPCADVLGAQAALGQVHLVEAAALARTALASAEAAGLAEVACAAHEVLGHCARASDIHEAESAFNRSLQVAEMHGLSAWKARALHELASIDALTTRRLDRVHEARRLAYGCGALATAAGLDLDLCRVLAFNFDSSEALEVSRRCVEAARRFRLSPLLTTALLQQAQCQAIAGRRDDMESAITEALADAGPDQTGTAQAWGECRATLSLLSEERKQALDELERAASAGDGAGDPRSSTFWALWALLRTTEKAEGEEACALLRGAGVIGLPFHLALLSYADAVALGSAGRHEHANRAFAEGEAFMARMTGRGGYGFVALRLVAERAFEDGWGDPVAWLRPTVVFFEEAGQEAAASACRVLLHEAGFPLPRRRRSDARVPSSLRALGVTARELDVLVLVGEQLPNDEIGSRLFISRRTVDKHVQHLLAKTGLTNRAELRALGEAGTGEL